MFTILVNFSIPWNPGYCLGVLLLRWLFKFWCVFFFLVDHNLLKLSRNLYRKDFLYILYRYYLSISPEVTQAWQPAHGSTPHRDIPCDSAEGLLCTEH